MQLQSSLLFGLRWFYFWLIYIYIYIYLFFNFWKESKTNGCAVALTIRLTIVKHMECLFRMESSSIMLVRGNLYPAIPLPILSVSRCSYFYIHLNDLITMLAAEGHLLWVKLPMLLVTLKKEVQMMCALRMLTDRPQLFLLRTYWIFRVISYYWLPYPRDNQQTLMIIQTFH